MWEVCANEKTLLIGVNGNTNNMFHGTVNINMGDIKVIAFTKNLPLPSCFKILPNPILMCIFSNPIYINTHSNAVRTAPNYLNAMCKPRW